MDTQTEEHLAALRAEREGYVRQHRPDLVELVDEQIAYYSGEKPKAKRKTRKAPGVETAVNR